MLAQLVTVIVAAVCAPILITWLRRYAFWVLALAPLSVFVWALLQTPNIDVGNDLFESYSWIPQLDFYLSLELDVLSWVMCLLVGLVGALVLFYCRYYFPSDAASLRLFAGLFLGFVASMLGLVLANDVLLLFVFWELTTVFSYLLIGYNPERKSSRRAAMKALIVTTAGGLALFVGFLILSVQAGTTQLSEILANPPSGTTTNVAIVLILIGALSKSALFPFHFWLPAAMAAPTPVSAYLHAAAMVKAGIYLIGRMAPTFYDVAPWRPIVLIAGCITMLIGGYQALKQTDLKLLLAHGTISQLGLIAVLLGVGTELAALAGLGLLIAHALFKAALFMSVGVLDRSTGTRDFTRITGVRQALPLLSIGIVLAALSMAAVIPTIGFVAKESAFAAYLEMFDVYTVWPPLVFAALLVSSVLTAAYTLRFVYGALANKPHADSTPGPTRVGFQLPTLFLGAGGLLLGLYTLIPLTILSSYADDYVPGADDSDFAFELWHGFNLVFTLSLLALGLGAILFWKHREVALLQGRLRMRGSADATYHAAMRGLDRLAVEVTGSTQRGSLPTYLSIILVVVIIAPLYWLVTSLELGGTLIWWDSIAQAGVGVLMVSAAVAAARSRRRLRAVVLLGVTGYGVAILFALHGAPDLALTQVLVETVTLVFFVFVMRRLPPYFSNRPLRRSRWIRLSIGVAFGTVMGLVAYVATNARNTVPISKQFPAEAVEFGGGSNVVNVALVDIRAWDTMGEISVLVVAATGVASLIFLRRRNIRIVRPDQVRVKAQVWALHDPVALQVRDMVTESQREDPGRWRTTWLEGGSTLAPERRSVILEVVTRLVFHTMILFSVFLLFAGHNGPGGGFAGGLVVGIALLVRYLAGGRYELSEAIPFDAGRILGLGLIIAIGSGMVSLLVGSAFLQSAVVHTQLPLLGEVHFTSSLFFDMGVYLVVIGLVLDVLRSLGAEVDYQVEATADSQRAVGAGKEANS